MGGGKKKRKRNDIFGQALDFQKNVYKTIAAPTVGNVKSTVRSGVSTVGNTVGEFTGANESMERQETAAEKAARAQEDFNKQMAEQTNQMRQDTIDQQAREQSLAEANDRQIKRDEKRRSARSRQRAQAKGRQGRRSTILTGNQQLGAPATARKTLLGQ